MTFDEAGREDDGHQEPLPAEDREIEGDARPLVQIEQGDAFVAQRHIERSVGDPQDVRTRVHGLHHGVRECPGARGGGDVFEEEDRVDSVVAEQRVREPERCVNECKIRGGTEGWAVDLEERAPGERVP